MLADGWFCIRDGVVNVFAGDVEVVKGGLRRIGGLCRPFSSLYGGEHCAACDTGEICSGISVRVLCPPGGLESQERCVSGLRLEKQAGGAGME